MSDRAVIRRITPSAGLTIPLETWQAEVDEARQRTSALRRDVAGLTANDLTHGPSTSDELALAFEELSVAEEELRVQNETLSLAHATIEADRERYRALFHEAPVPYLVTDSHGTIRDANAAAGSMLNRRALRLRGKPIVVFAQDSSRKRLRLLLAQMNCGVENATTLLNITPRGSGIIRTRVTVAGVRDGSGRVIELRWLLVDRTPQIDRARVRRERADALEALVARRTAELERAHELKNQLVANVSHEFRTALAAIGGYSDLLALGVRGQLSEAQLGDVTRIHTAYEHLAKVVNDLLRYSKLTVGSENIEVEDVTLEDALRGVGDLVRPQAGQNFVTVRVAPPADPVIVRANADRVRQIVLNLLGNAVKFTEPHGTVTIHWRAAGASAFVDVEDTGPGIPTTHRETIFQPFVRLKTDPSIAGTGLGLAISRDMARAMGGDLTVHDRGDGRRGACFSLRLPLGGLRSTRIAEQS